MIHVISFLALVASTLGCGVPQFQPLLYRAAREAFKQKYKPTSEQYPSVVGGKDHGIINGRDGLPWPWQVSIQTSTDEHFCGGTLINRNWVLTAAHCSVRPRNHYAVLGQYDRSSDIELVQVKGIAKVITHPDYNKWTKFNNDVALLKLATPAELTSRVYPVCLPSSSAIIAPGTRCVTTGWGRTEQERTARFLQEATIPIMSQAQCKQSLGQTKITDGMICAGASGASSCQGDSGGPLVCESSGVWYQVGIVSWGKIDCNVKLPIAYTRVSYFRNWIDEVIRSN